MPETAKTRTAAEIEKFIKGAAKRFDLCVEADAPLRVKMMDDLEFLEGDTQWSERAKRERMIDGRPMLVVNRLDQFVQHITNAQRQNRVSARVFPVDDAGDIETAEVMQGLIRHIEYASQADIAYDTAEFFAVACGRGYWLQTKEYCDPRSFDQDLKIVRVRNPFQIYLDPSHQSPTGADAEFGFKVTYLTKEEYEQEHPESDLASADWANSGTNAPSWMDGEGCKVIEYWWRDKQADTLCQMHDGSTALKSELGERYDQLKELGGAIVNERETELISVRWAKLNAVEILDETVWPGTRVPIVKVIGSELDINGKLVLKGIVRNMKDAQRQYNIMLTAQTEAAMDRGAVVMTEGQSEGHEAEWKNRVRKNPDVLFVKDKTIGGQPSAPPFRLPPDQTIAAKTEARAMAAEDLKALTGIYDASLGNRSNETSGVGIRARQGQSEVANFHFQDNLTRSIAHSCSMLVEAMAETYDAKRAIRIIGEDDTHKIVKINQIFGADDNNPQGKKYDFSVGKYDVICAAGPSFATKRKEGAETLLSLAQTSPIVMNLAPDLVVKCLDIPYAQEIAERLKKGLPPGIADEDEEDGKTVIPPQVKQTLDALTQQHQQMQQQLEAAQQEIQTQQGIKKMQLDSDERIKQSEIASRERIALHNSSSQIMQSHDKTISAEAIAAFQGEVQLLMKKIDAKLAVMGHEAAAAAKAMEGSRDTTQASE